MIFRKGDYKRVLTQGVYWLNMGETVVRYNLALPMNSSRVALEVLLKDEQLTALWHVIDVLDNELVLVYKNGKYSQTLTAGRYVFWKDLVDYTFTRANLSKIYITEQIDRALFAKK